MNNRQAGRRRGRNSNNSNRNQGNRGGVDRDNRIDNRARGNAAQMLEKYKKMAQDAQVNGDRVNAEYYHQFADHYFRVNADTQARREEQRQARDEQRGPNNDRPNNDRNDNSGDNDRQSGEQDGDERQDRSPPRGRQQNDRRPKASDQSDEGAREKTAAPEEGDNTEAPVEKKPVRARRPRKPAAETAEGKETAKATKANGTDEPNGFDVSVLPPAISIKPDDSDGDDGEPKKKPVRKRRTVKAKAAEEGDAAA